MSDVRAHYEEVRTETARLSVQHPTGFVFITSTRNILRNSTPGTVAEVSVKQAALAIVDQVARVSTPAEIAAHRKRGEEFAVRMNAQEQRHKGQSVHFVDRVKP